MDPQDEPFEEVRKLIALKRYESPGDAYFERFMDEFHEHQRAEMVKLPVHRLVCDRLDTWLNGMTGSWDGHRWVAAVGSLACGVLLAVGIFNLAGGPRSGPMALQAQAETAEVDPLSLLREF